MRRAVCLCALIICMLMAGCERRPLFDPSEQAEIRVRILTDGVSNVTTDIYNDKIPHPVLQTDIMRVMFYDKTGEHMLSEGFITRKETDADGNDVLSEEIMLSPGNFRVLAYNFDTPSTSIKSYASWSSAQAYTSRVSSDVRVTLPKKSSDLSGIYYQPDHLLVAREKELKVESRHGVQVIELDARTVVDTYYLQIRVKNIGYAASATAVLTGLSSSNNFGDNIRNEDGSGIYLKLLKSTDDRIEGEDKDVLCAVFNTFGRIDGIPSDLKVVINVMSHDGLVLEKEIDMVPVFETEDARERHWLLIEELWELPPPIGPDPGGGGWNPAIGDWENIDQVIPVE